MKNQHTIQFSREHKNLLLINQGHYIGNVYRGNTSITPEQLAEFKSLTATIVEQMTIPDNVIVQPLVLPAGLVTYGNQIRGITASTRKLKTAPRGANYTEWILQQLNETLQFEYNRATEEYEDNFLFFYCPYVPVIYMGHLYDPDHRRPPRHAFATRYATLVTGLNFSVPPISQSRIDT